MRKCTSVIRAAAAALWASAASAGVALAADAPPVTPPLPAASTPEPEPSAAEPPPVPPAPPAASTPPAKPPAPEPPAPPSSPPAPDEAQSGAMLDAIELAPVLGFGGRLDTPPLLHQQAPMGLLFGLGADVYFSSAVAVGLRYEHYDLGREGGDIGSSGTIDVDRDLNSLWLGVRAYPFELDWFGAFVALGLAASWQSVNATGALWHPISPGRNGAFSCEGSDSIAPALRAGLGVHAALADSLRLWLSASFDSYRLSDGSLDGCAPGAGGASVLALQTGLGYRFSPGL